MRRKTAVAQNFMMFFEPMLATPAENAPTGKGWIFEPKYDGIRAIAELDAGGHVRLWSRNGNDKTNQFPEITRALGTLAAGLGTALVLDGEVVALDPRGNPSGFQNLQGRIHLRGSKDIDRASGEQPVAYIAFDILRDGNDDLRGLPLRDRRAALEKRLRGVDNPRIRVSEQIAGRAGDLDERARAEGWEGFIAKDPRSTYQSGRRSPAWLKIKLHHQQEFVVGGWTEPRQTRSYFGALLLGVYDEHQQLHYVGHMGTGFDQKELARVFALLKAREVRESPFAARVKTNEPAHWVRPDLVAQVRFTELTSDKKLRHPVYLGLRDDKEAGEVRLENSKGSRGSGGSNTQNLQNPKNLSNLSNPSNPSTLSTLSTLLAQLRAIEDSRKDGTIELPNGDRLGVTNLAKVFWPEGKITKGELLRYYAAVSPFLLPVVEDRPLVMKRFPNGIEGTSFYQQQSRLEKPPSGVRIEALDDEEDPIGEEGARRFIGGSLTTLLYMTQIAAISQDPWFSRVQSPFDADYVAIDLDPTDTATFANVLDVARWVRDELQRAGIPGYPKTSGSSGLHIYIPLPPHTSYESGLLLCQIVATMVASRHPKVATVERTVRARPRGTVYVDYLQNILGKTLATAYSARASTFAGVSTPLEWPELDDRIDPRDFTVRTALARLEEKGDLWAGLRKGKPTNLRAVLKKYGNS